MFRHRPAPRHRGDPRRHGGLGEQLVICVLAVQISVAWLPSPRADSSGPSRSADQPPALVGLPASPPTSAPEPPTEIEVRFPASVTRVERAHEVRKRVEAVKTVSTNGIPSATLAAYQRAEAVMNSADAGCNISWQLIAAIGRVESDHGRYGGNVVGPTGVSRPGIYGIALNGTRNTAEIRDTDAGEYDRDPLYDRAVGPMQFIPSTWSVVGVDADGDGKRNPQDIDDAALAAAVYLCSGDGDLSTDAGRRQAVYRYNHSQSYVDLVLAIMAAYLRDDYIVVTPQIRAEQVDDDQGAMSGETVQTDPQQPVDLAGLAQTAAALAHGLDPHWPPRGDAAEVPGTDPGVQEPEECAVSTEGDADPLIAADAEVPPTDEDAPGDDVPPTDSHPDDGLECTAPEDDAAIEETPDDAADDVPEEAVPLP